MHRMFWVAVLGLAIPAFAYVGYPVLLFVLASFVQTARDVFYLLRRHERRRRSARLPSVTVVMAAYNEEDVLGRTLQRLSQLDYPRDRLEILVGSDGSSDRTAEIARQFADTGVRTLGFSERRGKPAVIDDCVAEANGDILLMTDANTLVEPDALRHIVRHFAQPEVGAVCGELRLVTPDGQPDQEGIYWRYELTLKILENRLNAVLGANGAIYAVRRELFPPLDVDYITDDFVIPMKIRNTGHRVVYDPEAVALEEAPASAGDEFRRRVRIGAGNWQALRHCWHLLMPWKGFVALSFLSHKVLRWFTPFCLLAGLGASLSLAGDPIWRWIAGAQVAAYAAAGVGMVLGRLDLPAGPLRLPAYFVTINAAIALGMVKGILGLQRAAWQRTARQVVTGGGKR